jgi:hypothetical protein
MLTLDGTLQHFRGHEGTFVNQFGVTVAEFQKLLSLQFLGTQHFNIYKRGSLPVEAALLLLLGRLRAGTATLTAMSDLWGVDDAFLSAFFRAICDCVIELLTTVWVDFLERI